MLFISFQSHPFLIPSSWIITRFVTRVRRHCLPFRSTSEYTPFLCVVRVTRSLVFYVLFCRSLFVFVSFFLLVILLSVLPRFTAFDSTSYIIKLFIHQYCNPYQLHYTSKMQKLSIWKIVTLQNITHNECHT